VTTGGVNGEEQLKQLQQSRRRAVSKEQKNIEQKCNNMGCDRNQPVKRLEMNQE
jgi:hypothetical protein